jgi:hypothetical protein
MGELFEVEGRIGHRLIMPPSGARWRDVLGREMTPPVGGVIVGGVRSTGGADGEISSTG